MPYIVHKRMPYIVHKKMMPEDMGRAEIARFLERYSPRTLRVSYSPPLNLCNWGRLSFRPNCNPRCNFDQKKGVSDLMRSVYIHFLFFHYRWSHSSINRETRRDLIIWWWTFSRKKHTYQLFSPSLSIIFHSQIWGKRCKNVFIFSCYKLIK